MFALCMIAATVLFLAIVPAPTAFAKVLPLPTTVVTSETTYDRKFRELRLLIESEATVNSLPRPVVREARPEHTRPITIELQVHSGPLDVSWELYLKTDRFFRMDAPTLRHSVRYTICLVQITQRQMIVGPLAESDMTFVYETCIFAKYPVHEREEYVKVYRSLNAQQLRAEGTSHLSNELLLERLLTKYGVPR